MTMKDYAQHELSLKRLTALYIVALGLIGLTLIRRRELSDLD